MQSSVGEEVAEDAHVAARLPSLAAKAERARNGAHGRDSVDGYQHAGQDGDAGRAIVPAVRDRSDQGWRMLLCFVFVVPCHRIM